LCVRLEPSDYSVVRERRRSQAHPRLWPEGVRATSPSHGPGGRPDHGSVASIAQNSIRCRYKRGRKRTGFAKVNEERRLRDVALCLAFFTRLPLPGLEAGERRLGEAIWAAPLAGLVVGLAGGIVYFLAFAMGVPGGVAAALALAATLAVTGCLHEDGLADVADGFGGGASAERKLEIMRDSRIGTYGATALLMSLLLRWSAVATLDGPLHVLCALLAAETASRATIPAFMQTVPPARPDGLAAGAGPVSPETAAWAGAIGFVAILLFLGLAGAAPAILALAVVFVAMMQLCLSQIGGQTGDTLGALQQAGSIAALIVATAVLD